MSIRIVLQGVSRSEWPRLMSTETGHIVLFAEPRKGTVLEVGSTEDGAVGDYINNWIMDEFSDYTGRIILENC